MSSFGVEKRLITDPAGFQTPITAIQLSISLHQVYVLITLSFDFDTLILMTMYALTMCTLASSHRESQGSKEKKYEVCLNPAMQKRWIITQEKCRFFLDLNSLVNEVHNPTSNFTQRKMYFLPTEWWQRRLVFLNSIPTLRALKSVTVFGLYVALTYVHSTENARSLYHSIDANFIFFHVKFEARLYLSVLRNRVTLYKNIGVGNRPAPKKCALFKLRLVCSKVGGGGLCRISDQESHFLTL